MMALEIKSVVGQEQVETASGDLENRRMIFHAIINNSEDAIAMESGSSFNPG
jgi:hypothetical protein